ncbi:flagellar basal body P-ring formation chaperone FlgA [Plastorhodobacter daqingensis]|uniref:Flagella basal body P-ring formation protein FlgA n=1 Tax=Plastorhodobacter daqingensis TaxID=1387281 RepID=A0ABW2UD84_9RHOB
MRGLLLLMLMVTPANAETLEAVRTLRPGTVVASEDITRASMAVPGALSDPRDVVGQEVRVAIYAGRPLRPGDLGAPAIIDRNQLVPLVYARGPLSIVTEGRALGRGGVGDMIRVMNLASRSTVTGIIGAEGAIHVTGGSN